MSGDRTVVITGAAGFLGGYTARQFNDSGWRVVGVDRRNAGLSSHPAAPHFDSYICNDISVQTSTIKLLERSRAEVCIHLAGPASVENSVQAPSTDYFAQTTPLLHLLEAVRISEVPTRILLVSSAAVYGNPQTLPIKEEALIEPISPYGFHKRYQELLLDQYHSLYGVRVSKVRVFSTYGAGLSRLAVWDLTRRALAGDRSLHGTGHESRDYLHCSDVSRAFLHVADRSEFAAETINIASGCETKITKLAETIYRLCGLGGSAALIAPKTNQNGNPVRWHADITRLKGLGFEPTITLESGLSSTVEWIKANA